jgi:hypothetical protein
MALPLSKRLLAAYEANVQDRLRACGAKPWPNVALWKYQDERERNILTAHLRECWARNLGYIALRNLLLAGAVAALFVIVASPSAGKAIFGFYLCGKLLFHVHGLPSWRTNKLSEDDYYWRDGRKQRLPEPVHEIVDAIRVFFPKADFAVSFIGHDPILHLLLDGRSYNALVWDVNTDGTVEIIPPPAIEIHSREARGGVNA